MAERPFSDETLAAIRKAMVIGLRAGTRLHRFIAVWAVVVGNRVFIRSWSLRPDSWFHVFRTESRGTIQVGAKKIPVRAVRTRSERLKLAVDRGYREKYKTPGSIRFVRDLARPKSKATTTELVPSSGRPRG